jgi:molecular chaperone DnaK
VTFDIDANGILHVSAEDKATGREQSMEVIPSSGLSDEQIDRMVEEAEQHREEDRRKAEKVQARNQADAAAYSAERFLREQGEKIPADARSDIEAKIKAVRDTLEGDDLGAIRRRAEELGQAVQQAGSKMYESATEPGSTPPPQEGAAGDESREDDEDVIEGDFSEA